MTSEQLQHARAERWRQASNPILTADDAREWMQDIGFCLFLPRRAHFAAAAPSFAEAVAGTPTDAPNREAMEQATSLLHRLAADAMVIPLNLFGVASAFGVGGGGAVAVGASDQPDFLVTREALPDVFSLVGGRNWKSGPGTKASPLVLEIWKQLDGGGAQTAAEIQTALGREVTEAAVLRGLVELWHGLRAIPVYDGGAIGAATRWELTQARFAAEMTASQKVAQTTALSVLVALYLESAIAASTEEIETFLSPLTARSRVREVVNGLQATRQLGLVSIGAQPLLHVAGSLPEFAEAEPETTEPRTEAEPEKRAGFETRPPFEKRSAGFVPRPRGPREGVAERRPASRPGSRPERRSFERKPFDRRERKPFERGERKPFERREGFAGRGGERPYGKKAEGERPYRKPEERGPFGDRPQSGERKPFEKRPFAKKPYDRAAKPFGKKPYERKPYGTRASGEARPFERKPFEKAERPFGKRPFDKERTGERPSFGGGGKFPPKKFGAGGKFPPKRYGAGPGSSGPGSGQARPWQERGRERPAAGAGDGERGGGRTGDKKRFDGPKKYGAGESFSGPKRFGGQKFGARGGLGSGPRPGGVGRSSFSGGFKRETPGGKRPFFRERPDRERGAKDGEGESRRRTFRSDSGMGEGAGPAKRAGGWKPKSAGGFSKPGKPGFKKAGKPFGKPGKPFGKSAKPFGKVKPAFGKSGKPFGKPGFKKPKPGGFKPGARKKKKKEGSGDAE